MSVDLPSSPNTLFPPQRVTSFLSLDLPLEKPHRLSQIAIFSLCLSIVFRRYHILEYQHFQFPLVREFLFIIFYLLFFYYFFSVSCQRKDNIEFLHLVESPWKKKKILKGLLYVFPSVTYVCISIYLTERTLWISISAEYLPLTMLSSSI